MEPRLVACDRQANALTMGYLKRKTVVSSASFLFDYNNRFEFEGGLYQHIYVYHIVEHSKFTDNYKVFVSVDFAMASGDRNLQNSLISWCSDKDTPYGGCSRPYAEIPELGLDCVSRALDALGKDALV